MPPVSPAHPILTREDLATIAEVATLRFPLRAAESRRLERMRTLLAASTELCRTLNAYTHCALVNCQGSHGVGSVREQGEAFHVALERYAGLVREVASDYRRFTVDTADAPAELEFPVEPERTHRARLGVA